MTAPRHLGALALAFCIVSAVLPAQAQVALERAFPDINLFRITDLRHDAEGRLYVAEQRGTIRVLEEGADEGLFLDIRGRVGEATSEGGILSLAFHPNYAANGFIFVSYVAVGPRRTVVARFSRSDDKPLRADPASEVVLLEVEQPMFNHNGGNLAFGPDGFLYIPLGDGGNSPAEAVNAQDPTTLLGSLLRIDVDNPGPDLPYGIPEDNPFAATDGLERDETYAYGFRSPWRIAFDAENGDLWVGDVGQDRFEEVSRVELGGNYGWDVVEGTTCHNPPEDCDADAFDPPVWTYNRSGGSSVTGGYAYRGAALPELTGAYVYGDFVSGKVWALRLDPDTGAATNEELFDTDFLISSFGVDADGELYVLHYFGAVYKIVRDPLASEDQAVASAAPALRLVGPNPFAEATTLEVEVAVSGPVRLTLHDVLGHEVAVVDDGFMAAGTVRRVRVDRGTLATGVYVLRASTARGQATQRVTVVR